MAQGSLSLNGIYGVGKTTQSRILRRRAKGYVAGAGRLSDHDPRWDTNDDREGQWWFGTSTLEKLADLLACSYVVRHKPSTPSIALQ